MINRNYLVQSADIGIGLISITNERTKFISYSYPLIINYVTFVTSMPKYNENTQFVYRVFEPEVWFILLLTLMFLFCFIWVMSRNNRDHSKAHLCWNVFEILFRQSINRFRVKTFPMKIIFSCWLIFSFEITSFYSNTLYSSMIVPAPLKTIETINDLRTALINKEITLDILKFTSHLVMLQVIIF